MGVLNCSRIVCFVCSNFGNLLNNLSRRSSWRFLLTIRVRSFFFCIF